MNLQYRVDLLVRLGEYIYENGPAWREAKTKAGYENGWFIPEFINKSSVHIARNFLQKQALEKWVASYPLHDENHVPKTVGIVMAGNIPLVGFHDWLCVFISGHKPQSKLSSKDQVLLKHLLDRLQEWEPSLSAYCLCSDMLKGCDAYIATGSNNSSRYFDYYFNKYPHIIRRNRTSVAILDGSETKDQLGLLADDVFLYFGLGCRNVTKIYVPFNYDFLPLLAGLRKYAYLADHHKYKNNYDYNLALHLLNKVIYMSTENVLLIENPSLFSPISQLHYEFYSNKEELEKTLSANHDLQCITGKGHLPFGSTQNPALSDYADGVDTLAFLAGL